MTHEAHHDPSPAVHPGDHRLLPIAGVTAAVVALLAHFGGGALVMHVGLPAVLAYFGLGAALPALGGGALIIVIAAVVAMNLLVYGARRWWRHRASHDPGHRGIDHFGV
jgi:hypothetical protein